MSGEELREYIADIYDVDAEFPWGKYPGHMVFRHGDNSKWFALIMNISKDKVGLQGEGMLDIVNIKCDPVMIGSLLLKKGFFPAYHMNKNYWISIALDGTVSDEELKMLIDMSFDLTAPKIVGKKRGKADG